MSANIEQVHPANNGAIDRRIVRDEEKFDHQPVNNFRPLANPAPLGFFAFACTLLVFSFIQVNARGVNQPNFVVSISLALGGLVMLLAGMWEFARANTFGATMFSAYAGFWISLGIVYWPTSGITAAYQGSTENQFHNAFGFFYTAFFIFTFCMLLATFRSTMVTTTFFFFLMMTYMLLMIGSYIHSINCQKAGGGLGLVTAAIGYYAATSALITPHVSYFGLPAGDLPKYRV